MNRIKLLQDRNYRQEANTCEKQFKEVEDTLNVDKAVMSNESVELPCYMVKGQLRSYL